MTDELAERAVDSIDAITGGPHPGFRVAHAKGTFCAGTFTPSAEAADRCSAAHFSAPVDVLVRVSNGSGDPGAPDTERLEGRGLAVKFFLPDGSDTDIVGLTLPCFFVRTPEDFVAFTEARLNPEQRFPAFLAEHPETAASLSHILPALAPPASYATCTYNSIHAFRAGERHLRWRWEPQAGEARLSDEEIEAAGPDYLQEELRRRLDDQAIVFTLVAIFAGEGDDPDDPTILWPDDRERAEMGRLEITGVIEQREQGDHIEVFDPLRVTAGIEPSGDLILHFRRRAYDVSARRRWTG